jgi:hypothetical protein
MVTNFRQECPLCVAFMVHIEPFWVHPTLLLIFRNFKRFKSVFFINLIGLSTGLTCVLLIYLWVSDELVMDKFHANGDRLYRIMEHRVKADGIWTSPTTSGPLAEEMIAQYPEIERALPTTWIGWELVSVGDNVWKSPGRFAGKEFFNMFSFELIHGDPNKVLIDKRSIVISESLAKKFFETAEKSIGKTIRLNHEDDLMVSGVFKDVGSNSTDQFEFVGTWEYVLEKRTWLQSNNNTSSLTVLMLKPGVDAVVGRPVFGTAAATIAAILVACSPVVVFMSLVPMADVPAATFWVGALAVAIGGSGPRAFAAGILTAIAILIRPNLVPLAVFPWLMVMVRTAGWRDRALRTALFAAASIPGALGVAWVNNTLYGSPVTSGYGDLGPGFRLEYAAVNLRNYAAWWLESQGPFAFVFLASFWFWRKDSAMRREYLVLVGFTLGVWFLYLFYLPFEAWWFLRFLLAAMPVVFLLGADVVARAAGKTATVRVAALAAFTVIVGSHVSRFIDTHDILDIGTGERRYIEPALHLASTIPPDAVIVAMQHSGSLRYYTGRLILRWDAVDPAWLDRAVTFLRGRGIATYVVIESWEEERLRSRFNGQQTLADLDRGPIATARGGDVRIYQLQPPDPIARPVPVEIPISEDRTCYDISPDFMAPKAIEKLR